MMQNLVQDRRAPLQIYANRNQFYIPDVYCVLSDDNMRTSRKFGHLLCFIAEFLFG